MDREPHFTLNSLWLSGCLNLGLICVSECLCLLLATSTRTRTIYCVRDSHRGTYRKHEYAWEGSGAQRSIYKCTRCVFCVRLWEKWKETRVCVCMSEGKQSRSVSTAWSWSVRCQREVSGVLLPRGPQGVKTPIMLCLDACHWWLLTEEWRYKAASVGFTEFKLSPL